MERQRTTARHWLMLQLALQEPSSYEDLVDMTGLKKPVVARLVRLLHSEGAVHRVGWGHDRKGRDFVALYEWGPGLDIPRPGRKISAAEQMAKLRLRRKLEKQNAAADKGGGNGEKQWNMST